MEQTTYSDLFEDEVAEVLRGLPFSSTIIMNAHSEFYPAAGICEDGIYTSGTGMYTEYFNGKRTGNHVGIGYLVSALAHTTFTVIERLHNSRYH